MLKKRLIVKLLIIYIFIVVIPLLTLTQIVTNMLNKQVAENTAQLIGNNLRTISVNIDEILRNLEFVYSPILTDSDLQSNLRNLIPYDERNAGDDQYRVQKIANTLQLTASYNSYLRSLNLYSFEGQTLFSTGYNSIGQPVHNNYDLEASDWYEVYNELASRRRWLTICPEDNTDVQLINYFPITTDRGTKTTELMSISISGRTIENIIQRYTFFPGGTIFVTDSLGNVATTSGSLDWELIEPSLPMYELLDEKESLTEFRADGTSHSVYAYTSASTGIVCGFITKTADLNNVSQVSKIYTYLIFGFMLLILTLAALVVYHYIYKPLDALFKAMETVQQGDFTIRLDEQREDEIGSISRNFNQMTESLQVLIDENYKISLLNKEAELQTVISQLNEHFLYNTLDAIHWLARKYDAKEISTVVFKLSAFYRMMLSQGSDTVTIAKIEEIIESYLYIQKFRLQELLSYTIEVSAGDDFKDRPVLKYLFQPLVENAILHGIGKSQSGGHVSVLLKQEGDSFTFRVEDSGAGIPPDIYREIIDELENVVYPEGQHFALKNVNFQLCRYYGKSARLHIESEQGIGTVAWFKIPPHKEKGLEDV